MTAPLLQGGCTRQLVRLDSQGNAVLACSALRKSYREILAAGLDLRVGFT